MVTPQVLQVLPEEAREGCLITAVPEAFARHGLSLPALSAQERRGIAAKADLATLTWERQLAPLHEILAAAASRGDRPGS